MKKSPTKDLSINSGILHALGHDLKQPLGLIRAYSYYLKKAVSELHPELVPYTEKINVQVDLVASMLNNLVESIKLENGQVTYKKEDLDITKLLQDVIQEIAQKHPAIPLTLKTDQTPRIIVGDTLYLQLALSSIIENSFRFSNKAKPVRIESTTTERSLVITISNTGLQIPSPEQDNIFEVFYKAKNASESTLKGLGLGLFLAKEIILHHQGALSLTSQSNITQVIVTLPLATI